VSLQGGKLRVAGIDPDTRAITTAWFGPAGQVIVFRDEQKGRIAEDRFYGLVKQFVATAWGLVQNGIEWVYIERPPYGVNPRATIDQACVLGAIRLILGDAGLHYSLVDPGTWKKAVLGNGHASKDDIKAWAVRALGLIDGQEQDAYDAACIAQFGRLASSAPDLHGREAVPSSPQGGSGDEVSVRPTRKQRRLAGD